MCTLTQVCCFQHRHGAIVVSLLRHHNGRNLWWEWVKKKSYEIDPKAKAKSESQNAATTPWSLQQDRWPQKRGAAACEAKKHIHVAILRNDHILPLIRCLKPHSLPRTLSTYTLPSFSHCSHMLKACATPTNIMRTYGFKGYWDALSIHCKYIHLVNIYLRWT